MLEWLIKLGEYVGFMWLGVGSMWAYSADLLSKLSMPVGCYNPDDRSVRVQTWVFYFLDPLGGLCFDKTASINRASGLL